MLAISNSLAFGRSSTLENRGRLANKGLLQGVGATLSLLGQAMATIRRNNGTALYVPDNYAGAFVDSTGTQPVTAVNDLVGLLTDRSYGAGNLGANTAPTLTTGNWTTVNTTISGGVATVAGVGMYSTFLSAIAGVQPGKSYQVTYTISDYVSGSCYANLGGYNDGAPMRSGNGVFTEIQAVTNPSSNPSVSMRHTLVGKVSNISVQEVLGNHAVQGTTASKPLVTQVPKRLGPNLVVGSTAPITANEYRDPPMTLVIGKSYLVSAVATKASGTSIDVGVTNGAYGWQSGGQRTTTASAETHAFTFTASDTVGRFTAIFNSATGSVSSYTVQEVLEWTPALDFDGSNDSLSLPINTGTSGVVIAGARPSALGWQMVFGTGAQLGTNPGVRLGIGGTTQWEFTSANGATNAVSATPSPPILNTPVVLTGRWTPSLQSLRVNGVVYQEKASAVAASTNGALIGSAKYPSTPFDPFNGDIGPVVYIPGAISDADLKTIERWVAQQMGVTYAG